MIDFGKVSAFIFDNDGVIVNSEPLSCGALRELFREYYDVDIGDDFSKVIGTSDTYAMKYYIKKYNLELPDDFEPMIERKAEIYFDMAKNELSTFSGFHKLLEYLSNNFDLAVASSGNHDKIKFSLEQVNASKYFPVICSATEVEHGKPAPDLFEFTAECLGVNSNECVVIEDSIKGIQGAKAAGMQVIGFTSSFAAPKLKDAGADMVVDSYEILLKEINSNR